jgi:hypothetical protein
MTTSSAIAGVYIELVRRPYFFVVHSMVSERHERYDRYAPATLKDFMLTMLEVLSHDRPGFMESLAEIDDREFMKSAQHRRYVAKERELLYIKNPHLVADSARFRGYWIGTNVSHTQVDSFARVACEAAGVKAASIRKLGSLSSAR